MKKGCKIIVLTLVLIFACVGMVSAASRTNETMNDIPNLNCPIVCPGSTEFKIGAGDPLLLPDIATLNTAAIYTNPVDQFKVRITVGTIPPGQNVDGGQKIVTWEANAPVCSVITKNGGGNKYFVYDYTPTYVVQADESSGDFGGLGVPHNGNNYGKISHLTFCYKPGDHSNDPLPPPVGVSVPEFPTVALPIGMIIGVLGLVYVVTSREK